MVGACNRCGAILELSLNTRLCMLELKTVVSDLATDPGIDQTRYR